MSEKIKVFLIEDNSMTAYNTIECFNGHMIDFEYFNNLENVLSEIDDNLQTNDYKIVLAIDLNLPYEGADFDEKDIEKTDFAQFTGWVWLHKNIFLHWEKYKMCISRIIVYSAFIKWLDDYFEKYPDEKKFVKNVVYLDKSETIRCYEKLAKEISNEKKN